MSMHLATRMQLSFGAVWFGTRILDVIFPPDNPTFNAALALLAAFSCLANHLENSSSFPSHQRAGEK